MTQRSDSQALDQGQALTQGRELSPAEMLEEIATLRVENAELRARNAALSQRLSEIGIISNMSVARYGVPTAQPTTSTGRRPSPSSTTRASPSPTRAKGRSPPPRPSKQGPPPPKPGGPGPHPPKPGGQSPSPSGPRLRGLSPLPYRPSIVIPRILPDTLRAYREAFGGPSPKGNKVTEETTTTTKGKPCQRAALDMSSPTAEKSNEQKGTPLKKQAESTPLTKKGRREHYRFCVVCPTRVGKDADEHFKNHNPKGCEVTSKVSFVPAKTPAEKRAESWETAPAPLVVPAKHRLEEPLLKKLVGVHMPYANLKDSTSLCPPSDEEDDAPLERASRKGSSAKTSPLKKDNKRARDRAEGSPLSLFSSSDILVRPKLVIMAGTLRSSQSPPYSDLGPSTQPSPPRKGKRKAGPSKGSTSSSKPGPSSKGKREHSESRSPSPSPRAGSGLKGRKRAKAHSLLKR